MKTINQWISSRLLKLIDFFYPPFKPFFSVQFFRYAACGGTNTVLSLFAYGFAYHYIFTEPLVRIMGNKFIKRYIAADYMFAFWVAFIVGFYLNRYVVFRSALLPRKVQLFRYFLIFCGSAGLNYFCLSVFVDMFHFPAIIAKMCAIVVVVTFSFFSQKYFTFKK